MHYLSYHCSIKKCTKEPHNFSRQRSPWSYAGLPRRWWNSQIPWQWWIAPCVTNSDTERGVKAIGRQNGGLFKVHEGNFDMFYCFLFILITEILKWNCGILSLASGQGDSFLLGSGVNTAASTQARPPYPSPPLWLKPACQTLKKGPWHMGFFSFSSIHKHFSKYVSLFVLVVKILTWCNKILIFKSLVVWETS